MRWVILCVLAICLTGCMSVSGTTADGGSWDYRVFLREPEIPKMLITKGPELHDASFTLENYTVQQSLTDVIRELNELIKTVGVGTAATAAPTP